MEYIFSLEFIYLVASITYILGLKMLGRPQTARKGNIIAAIGMTLAILGTLFLYQGEVASHIYILIGIAILIGSIIGWAIAKKVAMDTPEGMAPNLMAGNISNSNIWKEDDKQAQLEVEKMFSEMIGWAVDEGADMLIGETFIMQKKLLKL